MVKSNHFQQGLVIDDFGGPLVEGDALELDERLQSPVWLLRAKVFN